MINRHFPHRESAGVSLGMIIVVAGLATMIFGSTWIGLIATLVGLVSVAGFVRSQAA
jgi:nicotinamide riboside transporter PnuC